MRFAQSGGPSAVVEEEAAVLAALVASPNLPPVVSKAARPPAWKLCFMLPAALIPARRNGDMAARAPVLATAPSPEATPAAPD